MCSAPYMYTIVYVYIMYMQYSSPQCYVFPRSFVVYPRPNILSQARKSIWTVLRGLRVAELPWSGAHLFTIFLKFGIKAPLKKLRNLSLRLRGGSWRVRSWLTVLYWLKLTSRYLIILNENSNKQQLGNTSIIACFEEILLEKLCLFWLQCWMIQTTQVQLKMKYLPFLS